MYCPIILRFNRALETDAWHPARSCSVRCTQCPYRPKDLDSR